MKKVAVILAVVIMLAGCKKSDSSAGLNIETIGAADVEKIIADNKGKVLILNVFASWCPPCKEETPGFVRFYASHGNEDFELIGLSVDANKADLAKFLEKYDVNYPVYHIPPSVQRKLLADKIPTSHIYAPDGEYYTTVLGAIDERVLAQIIERLGAPAE